MFLIQRITCPDCGVMAIQTEVQELPDFEELMQEVTVQVQAHEKLMHCGEITLVDILG